MKNEVLDDKNQQTQKALGWGMETRFKGFLLEIITTMKEVCNR